MSGNGEHLQVVFLIDTRSYNTNSALITNDTIGLTQALSLSALKILQSLVGLGGGKGGGTDEPPRVRSIRWGYKFFDSLRPCSGYRHRDFHDFNLTNFEKFEDELRNKFKTSTKENESFSDGPSSKKQLKNTPGLKVWSQDFAPADHLAVALCEVAQDFQWQAPDIMSPSRNTRSRLTKGSSNSSSVNKSDKTNLTFLFMACPWNGDDLKEFVKMRSNQITTSDLLEVIVHDDVRTDFLEKHHVKLIWFDTRIVISNKLCKCNKSILEVVQGMMETINGHLIPLNAILSMGSQVTSSISTILNSASVKKSKSPQRHSARKKEQPNSGPKSNAEKCLKKSVNIFEHFNTVSNCMIVSSVMDYCCCKAHLSKQNPSHVSEIMTTLYVPKGDNLDVFCCLKITSLSANSNFRKLTCVEKSSSELNKSITFDCANEEERETELIDGINTVIKGSMPRDQIQLHCLNSKSVYSCLGLKPKPMKNETNQKVDDNCEEQLSNSFSSLMEQLARNHQILVLDVSHSEWLTNLVAIMEPLTSSVASLRLISPKSALNMQNIKTGLFFSEETEKCHQSLLKEYEKIEEEIKPSERAMEKKAVSYVDLQELDVRQFRPYQLELWYKSAPSCGVNSQYITQLTSIQGANSSNMSTAHGEVMMDLRDLYCKDPVVLGKSSLPFPHNNPQATKATSVVSNQAEHKKRLTRAKSFGGISGSRTGIILENSKKLQKNKSNELVSKEEEGKKELPAQKDKATVNINEILAEFSSSEDMLKHLKDSYENQLQQDSCPCLFAQTVVSIAKHFVKVQQNEKDTIEETKKLLKNCLVMSNKQLREKYQREDLQAFVEERIREVILQVVLQLEMEALSPTDILSIKCGEGLKKEGVANTNDDDVSSDGEEKESELPSCLQNIVDEMVAMLQTVLFLADHNKLTMFLQDKLLPNYADTVPYMLVGIYEGLMQPVPSKLCSPSIEDLMSVQPPPSSSFGSVSSLEAAGSIPSNRPRGLKRLPSLANIKTRTISVDLKKHENKPKESSGTRVKKKPVVEEAKKVRRNLFMGDSQDDKVESKGSLSRRKSVAVMQTTHTWKSPRRSGRGCSRSGVILKTKTVKETPGKRQVLSAMLDKMERARQKQKVGSETLVQVVEESPEKPVRKTIGVRSSPRIKAASSLHGTKSFYSKSNHRHSRNLAKALTLGARIRGVEASMPPRRSRLAEHSSSIHESKDSEISQESPSKFLFSEIFSPEKLQCIRKMPLQGSDSPSHNTRQKVSLTPIKQNAAPEPMLTASGVKKSLLFSPVKVKKDTLTTECLSNDMQSGELKSPFKSPIGTPLRTPRKRKCLSQSPLATRSAEKSKPLETSSMFAENQEINTKKDDVSNEILEDKYSENKKPDIDNKMHEFQSTPPLKKIESPSNGKQSRCRISPREKSETLDYWPRKKVRSGTPSPTTHKTPPPSAKDVICTTPSPVWIETHKQSPTFHKVTPKSVGSSNKKVTPPSSNKRVTEKGTIFTKSNSRYQQQTVVVEEKLQKAPKSRRKLSTSCQNQTSNICCSFSSSAEDEEGDFLPSADQLFTEEGFHNLVGLISNQGLDSDSDPEIDFPKQQIHLNQTDQIRKENLLTPSYGLRRKRSRDSGNSNEKPPKVSRKKTPDFRNTGSSFECYQKAAGPSTRLSAPEGFANESSSCNNLQIPFGEMSSTSLSASFRKPSRRMTQNMPSAASGGSAVSSCAIDLSCSEFSNCSSFDGDEVFTEDSYAHESRDKGYRSPRGMHTPKCKHTPLSVRGLSQLLSSPLVSPSQRKSLGANEQTRFSRRGSSLSSPK